MPYYHFTYAGMALLGLVGSLFVAGSACVIASPIQALAVARRDRPGRRPG